MNKEWGDSEKLAAVVAAVLIIVGLKLATVGVGPMHVIQDDGLNVAGGFLTLAGGLLLGTLRARGRVSKYV